MNIEQRLLEEIEKYNSIGADSIDIVQIMHYRNTITMNAASYASYSGKLNREKLIAIAKREDDIAIIRIDEDLPEWKAAANAKPARLDIAIKESDYKSSEIILKATYKVLDEINQRVAFLRNELPNSRNQT